MAITRLMPAGPVDPTAMDVQSGARKVLLYVGGTRVDVFAASMTTAGASDERAAAMHYLKAGTMVIPADVGGTVNDVFVTWTHHQPAGGHFDNTSGTNGALVTASSTAAGVPRVMNWGW